MKRNSWTDQHRREFTAHARKQGKARAWAQRLLNAGVLDACKWCGGAGCVECRGLGAVNERKGEG